MFDEHVSDEEAVNQLFRAGAMREVHTLLRFWFACPRRRCRRVRRCIGNPYWCGPIFWPVVRPEARAWWRAIFDARRDGLSARQAMRLADDAAARQRRIDARKAQAT